MLKFLLLFLAISILAVNAGGVDISKCSTADLMLTSICKPKMEKLTAEIKKHPSGSGLPDPETLQRMKEYCDETNACVSKAECPAIRQKLGAFSKTCERIASLGSPVAQCSAKLKKDPSVPDCVKWYFMDKGQITTSQKCEQFKKQRSCILAEMKKRCSGDIEGDFNKSGGLISQNSGCA
ncbi:unnamed protein product [Caenorhabditis bovis]|uniref:T20D4.11-like domain-containing protein n=1 Tax=Caenorhabditis bovis TaxID=2654633 RepID=A0A8S1EWY3_9PELO|nr:unnamed protein product [Caenorhabditis bovis]